jgi:hypothetical protein
MFMVITLHGPCMSTCTDQILARQKTNTKECLHRVITHPHKTCYKYFSQKTPAFTDCVYPFDCLHTPTPVTGRKDDKVLHVIITRRWLGKTRHASGGEGNIINKTQRRNACVYTRKLMIITACLYTC